MKKFLTTLLIVVILLGGILGPFGVSEASEGSATAPATEQGTSSDCRSISLFENAHWYEFLFNPVYAWCRVAKTFANSTVAAIIFDAAVGNLIYGVGYLVFHISSVFLTLSGFLLDQSIGMTVTQVGQIEAVNKGWGLARDAANMFFIFILLYIAISTILQIEGFNTKKLLTNIIIVALLVNFSLVITKVVIDTSNIIALQFYNSLTVNGTKNISEIFMNGLKLQTITDVTKGDPQKRDTFSNTNTATVFLGGTLLILVSSFVFFALSIMFIARSVILMFLMILSPLAFLASVLPGTSEHAKKWWKTLLDQSFFAPACLFLIYFVANIISEVRLLENNSGASATTISEAFNGNPAHFSIIFNFVILIAMMIATLVIAKSMGAYGADTMMKWGDSARKWGQGFVGRNTIGRAAGVIAEAETTKRFLGAIPGGRLVAQGLNAVAAAPFGGTKGGYTGAVKQIAERQAKYADYLGKGAGGVERQKAYVKSLEGGTFAKGLRTYTGIGSAGPQAVKMIEKNTAKQAAKKSKETELAKLKDEKTALETIPKEKDETRLKELKLARTLTSHPGELANISDEMAKITKRKERMIAVLNRISDIQDQLEMSEKIGKLEERGKGESDAGGGGKPSK
ncbi:MAG: hypothetical protein HZC03_02265 [Candidatus Lloydbacteria bacterium]|nr:hypothetical protein [Candidatus Lloydbacteria bacterium]